MTLIHGIHHITAIASDPKTTVDFYTRVLGLRLVKKSVNQDDVETYHLFFGDRTGEPGMDLTFFTFQPIAQGTRGVGQVTTISLAVPEESLKFWVSRFIEMNVKHEEQRTSFGKQRVIFYDPDDQKLELVGVGEQEVSDYSENIWTTKEISEKRAIRYFYSAKLSVISHALIDGVLDIILGYKKIDQENNCSLYQIPKKTRAAFLEVEEVPSMEQGLNAAGTVHHIAFAVDAEKEQVEIQRSLIKFGLYPTEVINRYYFKSVYFRTPAGVLFEIATNGPGFTADESESELGKKLALPPFLEPQRQEIEANLDPI